jgi:hypothetical protein
LSQDQCYEEKHRTPYKHRKHRQPHRCVREPCHRGVQAPKCSRSRPVSSSRRINPIIKKVTVYLISNLNMLVDTKILVPAGNRIPIVYTDIQYKVWTTGCYTQKCALSLVIPEKAWKLTTVKHYEQTFNKLQIIVWS